eukprot:305363_1
MEDSDDMDADYYDEHDHNQHTYDNNHHQKPRKNSNPRRRSKQNETKLYVGDKILLANKRSGKVTSLGPKPDKDGIWVRVVMDTHTNAQDMFNETKRNKTIWVPIQRVERIISHGKKFDITIDDRVIERKKRIHGTVKYVGPTHFDKGVWFGVELDKDKGKNNGTVKKKFYLKHVMITVSCYHIRDWNTKHLRKNQKVQIKKDRHH